MHSEARSNIGGGRARLDALPVNACAAPALLPEAVCRSSAATCYSALPGGTLYSVPSAALAGSRPPWNCFFQWRLSTGHHEPARQPAAGAKGALKGAKFMMQWAAMPALQRRRAMVHRGALWSSSRHAPFAPNRIHYVSYSRKRCNVSRVCSVTDSVSLSPLSQRVAHWHRANPAHDVLIHGMTSDQPKPCPKRHGGRRGKKTQCHGRRMAQKKKPDCHTGPGSPASHLGILRRRSRLCNDACARSARRVVC